MAEDLSTIRTYYDNINNPRTLAEDVAITSLSQPVINERVEVHKYALASLFATIIRLRKKNKVLARRVQKMKQKTCRFEYTITKRGEHISFGYKCTNCKELYAFNSFKYCPNCGHKIVDMS